MATSCDWPGFFSTLGRFGQRPRSNRLLPAGAAVVQMNVERESTQGEHRYITLAAVLAIGCGEPSSPEIPTIDSFGTDGSAASGAGGTGGAEDDAGGLDDTAGGGDPHAGECFIEEIIGVVGERYQCRGDFTAYFGADGLEEEPYDVSFGDVDSADSYDKPFVVACCGPLVEMPSCPDGDTDQHLWACYMDAVQQLCVGIGTKVEEVRQNVPDSHAFIKPSLAKLRDWLNEESSIIECQDVFMESTGLKAFDCSADYSSLVEGTTWAFSNTEHGLITNPYVRVDYLEIVDVEKPDVGEPCTDLHDNDTYIPLELGPQQPGWTRLVLASGTVVLQGPSIDGRAVWGRAGLASEAAACEGKQCSSLAADLEAGAGTWRLEGLQLHSVGAASAGSGRTEIGVDEYTISLFGPVDGIRTEGGYEIDAGTAVLSLSGRTAFGDYSLTTTNRSRIVLRHTPQGWTMLPFEIGYIDRNGDAWSLVVDAPSWAPVPLQ